MLISKKRVQAFTMIETLVALVIISIGILGFALMQVESLKAAKIATERTKAILFATDMMDRIRSNRIDFVRDATGAPTPNLNIAVFNSALSGPGAEPATLCADPLNTANVTDIEIAPNCTVDEMAAYELWQWRTMIADPKLGLGSVGKASVSVQNALPSNVEINIVWSDRGEQKSYILESRLFSY